MQIVFTLIRRVALLKHFNAVTPLKALRGTPSDPGRKPRGRGGKRAHPTHRLVQGVHSAESPATSGLEGGLRESYTIAHENPCMGYVKCIIEVTIVSWCADNAIIA